MPVPVITKGAKPGKISAQPAGRRIHQNIQHNSIGGSERIDHRVQLILLTAPVNASDSEGEKGPNKVVNIIFLALVDVDKILLPCDTIRNVAVNHLSSSYKTKSSVYSFLFAKITAFSTVCLLHYRRSHPTTPCLRIPATTTDEPFFVVIIINIYPNPFKKDDTAAFDTTTDGQFVTTKIRESSAG